MSKATHQKHERKETFALVRRSDGELIVLAHRLAGKSATTRWLNSLGVVEAEWTCGDGRKQPFWVSEAVERRCTTGIPLPNNQDTP